MPQKILVALDGSEISSKIAEFAAKTVSHDSVITLFSMYQTWTFYANWTRRLSRVLFQKNIRIIAGIFKMKKDGFWKRRLGLEENSFWMPALKQNRYQQKSR